MALLNFVTDPSGGSDLTVNLGINGGNINGGSVKVKYLRAPSVSEKFNVTWAGQVSFHLQFGDLQKY